MAIAYDPKKAGKYVLAAERTLPVEKQTAFLITVPDARVIEAVENAWRSIPNQSKDTQVAANRGTQVLTFLKYCLKGWENFLDSAGRQVPFVEIGPDGLCPMQNIERIHPDARFELALAIEHGKMVSEADRKN